MDWLARELRLGARLLAREKAFSLAAALTLAVCIGANTALFSVVHNILLRPLPFPESDRIVLMANAYPKAGAGDPSNSGVPDYYDRLRDMSVFEEQALFNHASLSVDQEGTPARLDVLNVTPSFFRLLRVPAALGRTFTEEEGEVGNEKKVVLSDAFWHRQFGGDAGVVGRDIRLDGQPYTIVGVMPKEIQVLHPSVALWRPLAFTAEQRSDSNRHSNNYENLGRLKPGATLEQAQSQVDALNAANLERFPQYKELLDQRGLPHRRDRLARPSGEERQDHALPDVGGRSLRAPHRLRQRREPGPRPRPHAPEGARHEARPGQWPLAARAPARHRRGDAFPDRGHRRALPRPGGPAGSGHDEPSGPALRCRPRPRRLGDPLRARALHRDRFRDRPHPRGGGGAGQPQPGPARRGPGLDRRSRRPEPAPRPDRGPGGLHVRAAGGGGPALRELPQGAADRRRLFVGAAPHRHRQPAPHAGTRTTTRSAVSPTRPSGVCARNRVP